MNRKIIQVITGQITTGSGMCHGQDYDVIALCDDGTMWKASNFDMTGWEQLRNVPQGVVPSTQWPR